MIARRTMIRSLVSLAAGITLVLTGCCTQDEHVTLNDAERRIRELPIRPDQAEARIKAIEADWMRVGRGEMAIDEYNAKIESYYLSESAGRSR